MCKEKLILNFDLKQKIGYHDFVLTTLLNKGV